MEEKILNSFVKKMKGKVKKEDIILSIPDYFGEDNEYYCEILENKNNGRVWNIETTRNYNVKSIDEM